MHIHSLLHLYIQMCIQNINTLSLRNTWNFGHTHSDLKMKGTMSAAERSEVYIWALGEHKSHGFTTHTQHFIPCTVATHTCTQSRPSPLRPASLDPTDSLQSALEPRGSSLPLEPVSDTVIWHWQWQSQRPPLPGRTKQTWKGKDPLLTHCSDCCCCCFKGVFVQKCSFYDCYYNYCYDYLIKDLYHTEERAVPRFSDCDAFREWVKEPERRMFLNHFFDIPAVDTMKHFLTPHKLHLRLGAKLSLLIAKRMHTLTHVPPLFLCHIHTHT